ncbi:metallophosphoesterase [Kocuria arenosa]|uniref:metallophosphoesterase n=1 Tax=Kocuria arenosa TaxID=3071446 RepID=UPI0034D53D3C
MTALRRFISDPNLGDAKVSVLRGYASTDDHDQAFIDTWLKSVPHDEVIVYLLGDCSKGGLEAENRAWEILAGLPGRKRKVSGNHCRDHPMHSGWSGRMREAMDHFESVTIADEINIDGRQVMLSHFPYRGDHEHTGERNVKWRLRDEGQWLVHGHVHDEWKIHGRQINVGWEMWPDQFATEKDILAIINETELRENQAKNAAVAAQHRVARASGLLLPR